MSVEYAKHPTKHSHILTTGYSNSNRKKKERKFTDINFLQQYFNKGQ